MGAQRPLRILCAREFQKSISESVHKLLADQIKTLGLQGFYEILQSSIRGKNGTEFSFVGIRHNVSNMKSYEGVDICWVEEAQSVSRASWDVLVPTIRKENSEIWISFNPELETDETYKRFVLTPPDTAVVEKVNWSDNPWFPEVLREEKDFLKLRDTDAYLNVWEGHCRSMLEGAIYAKEMRDAILDGRITKVPYDCSKPVHRFWDLGWRDHTSIWFAQAVGMQYRVLDFMQDSQKTISHFLQQMQTKGYLYGTDYLPHDADSGTLGSNGRSVADLMRSAGCTVRILPRVDVEIGINAARTIFPNCWFDEEKCADGIQALKHYRYDVDPDTGLFSKTPLHDGYSDAADGFRYLAMSLKEQHTKTPYNPRPKQIYLPNSGGASWMGA